MTIRRQKLILFIDAKEASTVLEVEKMIESITKVPPNNIRLVFHSRKQSLNDDNQIISDCRLSSSVTKAYPRRTSCKQDLGQDTRYR